MIFKTLRIIFMLIVLIAFIWGFSDSYSSHNIDNIAHIVAIGIDKSTHEGNNIKVSFQFVNTSSNSSESSSSDNSSTVVTSIDSTTLNRAINLMNSYIGKELNFSHCKVVVFSEDFAKKRYRIRNMCTYK